MRSIATAWRCAYVLAPVAAARATTTTAACGLLAIAQDRYPGLSSQIGIGASAPPLSSKIGTIAGRWSTDVVVPSTASAALCDAIRAWIQDKVGECCRSSSNRRPNSEKAQNEKDAVRTVYTAIAANAAISLFKGGSWMVTGSSSLFAEAVHSCVDTINQAMLAVGIERSKREADAVYNYGYQRERYVWGLISNVATLCGGAGVTIVHGLHSIWQPEPVEYIWLGLATMLFSALGEGYSLRLAANTLRDGAKLRSIGFWKYLRSGQDPTTTAVFMEDGIAVGGLAVATAAMIMTLITGEAIYDAYGSLFVGCVMGSAALWLIQKNRSYLLGRAMATKDLERAQLVLLQDPAVTRIFDVKSEGVGPDRYRFKVEIELNGRRLVRENLRAPDSTILRDIQKTVARGRSDSEFDDGEVARILELYGRDIVRAISSRISDLENKLIQSNPSIHHVDIEVARISRIRES